jgi:hypothetical protein
MTASDKTFAVSTNANIIDKPDGSSRGNHGKGWNPFELSAPEVEETIRLGLPISAQFLNGHRKTANFICAGFLAADVDDGMTLGEAQDHAFVRHHGGLIHTTASHTEARHRLRIVFLLDEAILSAADWADALFGLALLLGSDRSATDAARLFYGNSRAEIFRVGKTMAPDVVANLIGRGRDARASRLPLDGGHWPVDSVRRIAGPELIKLAGGEQVRMNRSTFARSTALPAPTTRSSSETVKGCRPKRAERSSAEMKSATGYLPGKTARPAQASPPVRKLLRSMSIRSSVRSEGQP